MSHPPPLPLRRHISRSLDNISEAVGKDKRRAPTLPPPPLPLPRPSPRPATVAPNPIPHQDPQYEIIDRRQRRNEENPYARFCSATDPAPDFISYDLQTFCKEVKLPKAVEVTDGFCGATEDIPVGYKLMMYFQKTTRVVQAKDMLDTVYNIPLGSSLKFAPIDEKPKKRDYSGFYYDSVEEMLQERSYLPKIVCAKGSFTPAKGRYSVNSKDILFPKKIDKSTLRGSRVTGIQCTKLGDEEIIKLPLDCSCGFSTATKDTQLYLSEYIKHVNEFPVKVSVFGVDKSMNFGIPTTLILQGEDLLKTLVARSLHSETELITEISVDLPIAIKCLSLDDEVSEHERVKKVYETFNSSKVSTIYSVTKTNAQHKAQQYLYAQIRQEDNAKYYDIIAPENVINTQSKLLDALEDAPPSSPRPSRHKILTHLLKHRSHSTGNDDSVDGGDADSPVRKLKLRNLLPGPGKPKSQSTDAGAIVYDEEHHKALNQANVDKESLKAEIKEEIKQEVENSLREDIRKLRVDNAHCLQQLARLNETIEKLQKQNDGVISLSKPSPVKPREKPSPNDLEEIYKFTPEENRKFLQSLDHIKILQLLDGMKLEKYKSEFKNSFVDGQLLATLSQTELVELKVNSLLHQIKLLNVIEGNESARKYLHFAEEDSYKQ